MIKTILEILIIVAAIVNMFAAYKDSKSKFESTFWSKVILVTSAILACCWFTKGLAFKAGPEALSYVVAFVHVMVVAMQVEFLRFLKHNKKCSEVEIPDTNEYIDIGKWEESDEKENQTQTRFIDMK